MKEFLKILGAAALMASVTPYKIEKNEETGTRTVKALLWKVETTPTEDGKHQTTVGVGFYPPCGPKAAEEELFADDVMEPVPPMDEPLVVSSDDVEPAKPSDFVEPEHIDTMA